MPNAPFRVVVQAPPRPPQSRLGREEREEKPEEMLWAKNRVKIVQTWGEERVSEEREEREERGYQ